MQSNLLDPSLTLDGDVEYFVDGDLMTIVVPLSIVRLFYYQWSNDRLVSSTQVSWVFQLSRRWRTTPIIWFMVSWSNLLKTSPCCSCLLLRPINSVVRLLTIWYIQEFSLIIKNIVHSVKEGTCWMVKTLEVTVYDWRARLWEKV